MDIQYSSEYLLNAAFHDIQDLFATNQLLFCFQRSEEEPTSPSENLQLTKTIKIEEIIKTIKIEEIIKTSKIEEISQRAS